MIYPAPNLSRDFLGWDVDERIRLTASVNNNSASYLRLVRGSHGCKKISAPSTSSGLKFLTTTEEEINPEEIPF